MGSQFCVSDLWDRNVTWDTDNPDFTTCFENTVLGKRQIDRTILGVH